MNPIFKHHEVFNFYKQFEAELLVELAKQPLPISKVFFGPITTEPYCGRILVVFEPDTRQTGEVAYAFLRTCGKVHHHRLAQRMYPQHATVYTLIENWGNYVCDCFHAAKQIQKFWKEAKEELVAAAWRPERVAKWLEAGVELEAM